MAAVLMEILFGFQYTWAIDDRILQREYGISATWTQLVFSSAIVCFSGGMTICAPVMRRIGYRATSMIGAVVYGAGLIIGGLGGPNVWTLILGPGVMMGGGIALGYMPPLVTAQKWFPNRKGIVTGVVVGAFGSGAFVLSAVAKVLLSFGYDVFEVLTLFGTVCGIGIVALSFFLVQVPESRPAEEHKERAPAGLARTALFWSLVAGLFAGTYAGLSVIGSLERIGDTLGTPEAFLKYGILAMSLGNACGRLGWGVLTELLGTRRAVIGNLGLQAVFVWSLIFLGHLGPAFIVVPFLIGFNYGGNFVLYVTEIARTYGAGRVAAIYGMVFLVYIVSGMTAPVFAGACFRYFGTYVPPMAAAGTFALAGAVVFPLLYGRRALE